MVHDTVIHKPIHNSDGGRYPESDSWNLGMLLNVCTQDLHSILFMVPMNNLELEYTLIDICKWFHISHEICIEPDQSARVFQFLNFFKTSPLSCPNCLTTLLSSEGIDILGRKHFPWLPWTGASCEHMRHGSGCAIVRLRRQGSLSSRV